MTIDGTKGVQGAGQVQQVDQQGTRHASLEPAQLFSGKEQKEVADLIAKEVSAQGTARAAAGVGDDPGRVYARYIAPPPDIIAEYVAPPPWVSFDGHVALINKVRDDGKIDLEEGKLIRKLFNYDIAWTQKNRGRDIGPKVADYLEKALRGVKMSNEVKELIFGAGGPGEREPIYYILPPPTDPGGPIYFILPPGDDPTQKPTKS